MNSQVAEIKKWASNYTVNNPFNVVQDAATGPIQSGARHQIRQLTDVSPTRGCETTANG